MRGPGGQAGSAGSPIGLSGGITEWQDRATGSSSSRSRSVPSGPRARHGCSAARSVASSTARNAAAADVGGGAVAGQPTPLGQPLAGGPPLVLGPAPAEQVLRRRCPPPPARPASPPGPGRRPPAPPRARRRGARAAWWRPARAGRAGTPRRGSAAFTAPSTRPAVCAADGGPLQQVGGLRQVRLGQLVGQLGERLHGAGQPGAQRLLRGGQPPHRRQRPAHHRRREIEEGRDHRGGLGGAQRRGPAGEVAPPVAAQARPPRRRRGPGGGSR